MITDVKKTGYVFEEENEKINMTEFAQIVIVMIILFTLIVLFILPFLVPLIQEFLEEIYMDTEYSKVSILIFLAYALCFVSLPIYQWIEKRIHFVVRTDSGFELSGKLKGLKKFLKDFSKLSDSELKQMELYDEYVIYSVVLNLKGNIDRESRKLYDRLLSFPKEKIKTKIKKYNYQLEVMNKKIMAPLVFIGGIWILMIILVIIEKAYEALFVLLVPLLVIFLIVVIVMMKKRNFQKRRDIILAHGIKIPGMIVEREEENCVIVKFYKEGRKHRYKTPPLNFSIEKLMSDDVDVYIYHGYCYVDYFKVKEEIK